MELQDVVPQFQNYLRMFNEDSDKPMNLGTSMYCVSLISVIVLFLFAVEHVARVARILRMQHGNALLIGMGGSGRQSLTRLAAYICALMVHGYVVC